MGTQRWFALLALTAVVGCATPVRTGQQWHDEVETGIKPHVGGLRSCYLQGLQGGYVPRNVRVTVNVMLVTVNEQRTFSYFYYLTHSRVVPPSSIDSPRFEKCIGDTLGSVGVRPAEDYYGRAYWTFVFDPSMLIGDQYQPSPPVAAQ